MKTEITHTCGCKVTHDIVGTDVHGERGRKAAWLADQPCMRCKRAQEAAAATVATDDMIALTGSDKQVAWATTIRADARKSVNAILDGKPLSAAQQAAVDALWAQADAGWWIDRRGNGAIASGWLREAAKLS